MINFILQDGTGDAGEPIGCQWKRRGLKAFGCENFPAAPALRTAIELLTPHLRKQKTGLIETAILRGRMVWEGDLEENVEKLAAPGRDFRAENGVV